MIGQHEDDFRVSRLLRNREDLTDAAYVEKNPTITGTSLENLNIYIWTSLVWSPNFGFK